MDVFRIQAPHKIILNGKRNVAQKKKKQFSILLTYLYNEIVYMCNDKILVQR